MDKQRLNARIPIVDDTLQNIQVLGTVRREQKYQLNVSREDDFPNRSHSGQPLLT